MSLVVAPQKMLMDTQVYSYAASGQISESVWNDFCGYVSRNFTYCISPLVVAELSEGLLLGDEDHFELNQSRLRRLYNLSACRVFLPLPKYYVLQQLFDIERQPPPEIETDYELCLKVAIAARNKDQLDSGVLVPGAVDLYRLNLDKLVSEFAASRGKYVDLMNVFRAGRWDGSDWVPWMRGTITHLGLEISDSNLRSVASGLDAMYHYQAAVFGLLQADGFDFSKHTSDLVDGQLLQYLCDPNLHFVTADKKMRNRTARSTQASRILDLWSVLESHPDAIELDATKMNT